MTFKARRGTLAAGLLLVLCALLVQTGCWSRRELNDLAIVVALGLDKDKDGYNVSAQFVNPSQVATKQGRSGTSAPVVTFSERGRTLPEALNRMSTKAPRQLYLSHLRVVVIGESLAREGIGNPLDFLSRNRELRTDFYLVVARDASAKAMVSTFTALEPIPANKLFTSLEMSQMLWAATGKVTLDTLINSLATPGDNPVLTGLRLTGDPSKNTSPRNQMEISPPTVMQYYGMAVFKGDRMVGWLDEKESKAVEYIRGQVKTTIGFIGCPEGGLVSMEVQRVESKIMVESSEPVPRIIVKLRLESDVVAAECTLDLTKPETVAYIEKFGSQKVTSILKTSIAEVQKKFGVDIFGFGEAIHRANPKGWKKLGPKWNEIFPKLEVVVQVDEKVRRIGTRTQPVKKVIQAE